MVDFFSDDMRRNPFSLYDQMLAGSGVFHVPPPFDAWLIFDYDGVKRALSDQETFSSAVPAPKNWFIFNDPPQHTKLRALISRAFTPRVIANLETRIRQLSRELLEPAIERGEFDLAEAFSVPLPMKVIAELIGIPADEWVRFKRWSDGILKLSYARSGGEEADLAMGEFKAVTAEMNDYLGTTIEDIRSSPRDDLLTRLVEAEIDGERLTQDEILGFFQLLVLGGQETTANLINNAILCLTDNPGELARLKANPDLLPAAIEEVLRYRSPLQWVMRTPKRDLDWRGQRISAGQLVLPIIGAANRDLRYFNEPGRFNILREANPHLAFGHGSHFCLGAALARLESKIALGDFLARAKSFELTTSEPWMPRQGLHVHGPVRLPIRYEAA